MKRASTHFLPERDMEWEALGPGISRKIMGWDNQIMMVKVKLNKGAMGKAHQHFHTQVTYCAGGKFEFTVGEDKQVVARGDGIYIPPNTVHGVVCLEEGVLIDVFSPVREDFLDGSVPAYLSGK
jgi:quercetin dioxygenase-like cupin family protein